MKLAPFASPKLMDQVAQGGRKGSVASAGRGGSKRPDKLLRSFASPEPQGER